MRENDRSSMRSEDLFPPTLHLFLGKNWYWIMRGVQQRITRVEHDRSSHVAKLQQGNREWRIKHMKSVISYLNLTMLGDVVLGIKFQFFTSLMRRNTANP